MKHLCLLSCLFLQIILVRAQTYVPPDFYGEPANKSAAYIPNHGQVVDTDGQLCNDVAFYSQGGTPRLYMLRGSAMSFVLTELDTSIGVPDTFRRLDMSLTGEMLAQVDPICIEAYDYTENYYLKHCGAQGIEGMHGYQRVVYEDVYPYIDMHFYSGSGGPKMAFVVRPGGTPSDLLLQFSGQDSLDVDVWGNLQVFHDGKHLILPHAVAYQVDVNDDIIPVLWDAEYDPYGEDGLVEIEYETYDPDLPLIFMMGPPPSSGPPGGATPPCWSSYVGGDGIEASYGTATDAEGSLYVLGWTSTSFSQFPLTAQGSFNGGVEQAYFLSKFTHEYELVWTSYYGGVDGYLHPWALAVKNTAEGPHIYVVGETDDTTQVTQALSGAYMDSVANGSNNGCIAKFDVAGELLWATYFGNGATTVYGATIDTENRLVITGSTQGGIPTPTTQPAGSTFQDFAGGTDAFVTQFDEFDQIFWTTYLGGDSYDAARSVKPTAAGLVVVGETYGDDFPLVDLGSGAYFRDTLEVSETFIAEWSTNDSLIWSTYFGGDGLEALECITCLEVTPQRDIFMIGRTGSQDLPVDSAGGWANPNPTLAFVAMFSKTNRALEWMTYLGDSVYWTFPRSITSDVSNNLYIAGTTFGYPVSPVEFPDMYYQEDPSSNLVTVNEWRDCFIQGFDVDHDLAWSTYFGGIEAGDLLEEIFACTWHDYRLYIAGRHVKEQTDYSTFFPTFDPGDPAWFDDSYNGEESDAFVASLCTNPLTGVPEDLLVAATGLTIAWNRGLDRWSILGLPVGGYAMHIFDSSGRLVKEQRLTSDGQSSEEFGTAGLASGVYSAVLYGRALRTVKLPVFR